MTRRLLFVAPHSFVVRNWLASGLVDLCVRDLGVEPVVLSHFGDASFQSPGGLTVRNIHLPLEPRGKYELPAGFPRLLYAIYVLRIRTYALELTDGSMQYMDFARRRDAGHLAGLLASRLLPRGTGRRALARRVLDSFNTRNEPAASILDCEEPAAMIVGSPGFLLLDQLMMVEAARRRLPVHCIVNSWDNMTSRGPMIRRPESLMVWNEHMRQQAGEIHAYPLSRTFVVGSLQFTLYAQPATSAEQAALYCRLGLPAGQPFFLFLTGQHLARYEAEDLRVLLRQLDSTPHRDVHVVVRLHPQVDPGPFKNIHDRRLVFDQPPRFGDRGGGGFRFGRGEIRAMAALLSDAKLVISSWGTTALLEAAIFDRPIIQLRWMEAFQRETSSDAARVAEFQRYLHLRPFDASQCRLFCDTPASLPKVIEQALAGGREGSERRRAAVSSLATLPLDQAPWRVVDVLKRELAPS
jgi:hypothetical protein